jgi:hypothetical protein
MIALTIVIILFCFILFLSSSIDYLYSSEELEKMGINPGKLECFSKTERSGSPLTIKEMSL